MDCKKNAKLISLSLRNRLPWILISSSINGGSCSLFKKASFWNRGLYLSMHISLFQILNTWLFHKNPQSPVATPEILIANKWLVKFG